MNRPMGRPVNTTLERTTITLPCDLKLATAIQALERGQTLSAFVEEALRDRLAAKVQR